MCDTEDQNQAVQTTEIDACFEGYKTYGTTLRTWFVAYGIGLLALAVSDVAFASAIRKVHCFGWILGFALAGVTLQVLLAFVNKTCNWYCYYGQLNPTLKQTSRYSWSAKISSWYAIDFWLDVTTFALFAAASVLVIYAIVNKDASRPPVV